MSKTKDITEKSKNFFKNIYSALKSWQYSESWAIIVLWSMSKQNQIPNVSREDAEFLRAPIPRKGSGSTTTTTMINCSFTIQVVGSELKSELMGR